VRSRKERQAAVEAVQATLATAQAAWTEAEKALKDWEETEKAPDEQFWDDSEEEA
jgi:hypothetical protein